MQSNGETVVSLESIKQKVYAVSSFKLEIGIEFFLPVTHRISSLARENSSRSANANQIKVKFSLSVSTCNITSPFLFSFTVSVALGVFMKTMLDRSVSPGSKHVWLNSSGNDGSVEKLVVGSAVDCDEDCVVGVEIVLVDVVVVVGGGT